jgi:predicted enzyme related to lactoylglutathione lyase
MEIAMPTNTTGRLEHLNVTVADPDALSDLLCHLFDWKIRWQGSAIYGGRTIHVGNDTDYIAIYSGRPDTVLMNSAKGHTTRLGLNHIGIVVEDLDETERRVKSAGLTTHSHEDYEPGRRFYFHTPENLEIEVVSYV